MNLGPKLYCMFQNGLAYEYLKGVALDGHTCRTPHIMKLVAAHFAQWHIQLKVSSRIFSLPNSASINVFRSLSFLTSTLKLLLLF